MDKRNLQHLWPGVPLALGSAFLFGATAPASKILLDDIDPQLLAGVLYLGAGVGLTAIRVSQMAFGALNREAPLRATDIPWLAVIVIFGGVIGPLLLMMGLSKTDATSGSLLLNLEGLATLGLAWLLFREHVDRKLIFGAISIMFGAVVLSWNGAGFGLDLGAILIAGACLAWGLDNNLTRKLSSADAVVIAAIKGLAAGAINVSIAFTRGAMAPPLDVAAIGAALGFFGVGLSLVLFILALRHLGTARTGAYFALAPFIGAVLAVVALGEPLSVRLAAAAALMGLGLWLHLAERHDHHHEHESFSHEHAHISDDHHPHEHGPPNGSHSHWHLHEPVRHSHAHFPDLHHRHEHRK